MAIVGKPSPTMPFTRPAKRKIPKTMSSVESVIVWADYRAERASELPAQVRQAIDSVERGDD